MSTDQEFQDVDLTCTDCQEQFTFKATEQAFFATLTSEETGKPFTAPKRCKPCRDKRKFRNAPNRKSEF